MASYHKTVAFWISIMIEDSVVNRLNYNRTFETKKNQRGYVLIYYQESFSWAQRNSSCT